MGIIVETRTGTHGEYEAVIYSEDAQRFLLDNLEAVAVTEVKKGRHSALPSPADEAWEGL